MFRTMKENRAEPARIFSVYLPASLYDRLAERAGKRRVNTLIKEILEKELSGGKEQQLKQQLIKDYQAVAQNEARKKEDKIWDETTDDGLN